MLIKDLTREMIAVSEKAAEIARKIRSDRMFSSLVEDKESADGGADYKTLADVLIQEVVKHDLSKKFPQLRDQIKGEETNMFTSRQGKTIQVSVGQDESSTALLLTTILQDNPDCAHKLASVIHSDVPPPIGPYSDLDNYMEAIEDSDIGIWIDPIDSTISYLNGRTDEKPNAKGLYERGLQCCTVLIGGYQISTGLPVAGLINQPFHHLENQSWQSRVVWGVCAGSTRLCSLPLDCREPRILVTSRRMPRRFFHDASNAGFSVLTPKGAGYKLLSVIEGQASAFALCEGMVYRWDSCGPHAILRAMGGGLVDFERYDKALGEQGPGAYSGEETLGATATGDTNGHSDPQQRSAWEESVEGHARAIERLAEGSQIDYTHPHHGYGGEPTWANNGGMIAYKSVRMLAVAAKILRQSR